MNKKIGVPQGVMYWARVVTLGIVVGFGLQFASAWTNPSTTPPLGNVSGPITTSVIAQYKAGAIGFGGLVKAYLGIDANNNRIVNVATPVDGKDAVNKDYIDSNVGGIVGTTAGWCRETISFSNGNKNCDGANPAIAPAQCATTNTGSNGRIITSECRCASGYTMVSTGSNSVQSTGTSGVVSGSTAVWYTCVKQ